MAKTFSERQVIDVLVHEFGFYVANQEAT